MDIERQVEILQTALAEAINQIAFLKAQNAALQADSKRYTYLVSLARDLATGEPVGEEFNEALDDQIRMSMQ
jgi:hypothetical protein